MLKFALLAASAAVLAVPAAAQDETAPDRPFEGFYVGGTFGLDSSSTDDSEGLEFDTNRDGTFGETVRAGANNAFSPGSCGGTANGVRPAAGCVDDNDDYAYSVRIGYDTRLGDGGIFVAGILAEATKHESQDSVSAFSTTPASYTVVRGLDHSFAARGRLGISPGSDARGLFYVTGGVAYGKLEHAFLTSNTANTFTQVNDDDYQLGGQVGGGAELYILPNVSIGLEYLYNSFEDEDYYVEVGRGTALATNPFLVNGGGTFLRGAEQNFDFHTFKVGVNFRF